MKVLRKFWDKLRCNVNFMDTFDLKQKFRYITKTLGMDNVFHIAFLDLEHQRSILEMWREKVLNTVFVYYTILSILPTVSFQIFSCVLCSKLLPTDICFTLSFLQICWHYHLHSLPWLIDTCFFLLWRNWLSYQRIYFFQFKVIFTQ